MLDETLNGAAVFVAPPLTAERAAGDLETILYSIASLPSHYRNFAVHYMRCRTILLGEQGRAALPGFLVQCGTSEKFREFITLYDGSVHARHAFLDRVLGGRRASSRGTRSASVFDDEDF